VRKARFRFGLGTPSCRSGLRRQTCWVEDHHVTTCGAAPAPASPEPPTTCSSSTRCTTHTPPANSTTSRPNRRPRARRHDPPPSPDLCTRQGGSGTCTHPAPERFSRPTSTQPTCAPGSSSGPPKVQNPGKKTANVAGRRAWFPVGHPPFPVLSGLYGLCHGAGPGRHWWCSCWSHGYWLRVRMRRARVVAAGMTSAGLGRRPPLPGPDTAPHEGDMPPASLVGANGRWVQALLVLLMLVSWVFAESSLGRARGTDTKGGRLPWLTALSRARLCAKWGAVQWSGRANIAMLGPGTRKRRP
jgi:hypothetical protein